MIYLRTLLQGIGGCDKGTRRFFTCPKTVYDEGGIKGREEGKGRRGRRKGGREKWGKGRRLGGDIEKVRLTYWKH